VITTALEKQQERLRQNSFDTCHKTTGMRNTSELADAKERVMQRPEPKKNKISTTNFDYEAFKIFSRPLL